MLAVRGARKGERWGLLLVNGLCGIAVGILAADALLFSSYFRARTTVLKQQLKWIMWGVGVAAAGYISADAAERAA